MNYNTMQDLQQWGRPGLVVRHSPVQKHNPANRHIGHTTEMVVLQLVPPPAPKALCYCREVGGGGGHEKWPSYEGPKGLTLIKKNI